ncbi:hypothetical protein M409DRAFT_57638 [Zasmidium cellare ATCC 36951]|uniref:F-box domain-containing protein n=1 Tax=Zasmidium cellare ATCC 36951 TaxID=1080233 RepID=A0A6A6CAU9_ZASCE|nr:uncharacterized protein M409DRAFT_57638 [Zasmidium cellare ATCC 36951]KAF2163358.1 hypothetical protein M409DRAFT_57638 [Zasmidium cellare ATCC 36951]
MLALQPQPPAFLPKESFNTLPAEVLLEIIPYIPFSPHTLSCLCLTCARLNGLIKSHEQSLVSDIKRTQIPRHALHLFPSLDTSTFDGIATLHKRLSTLTDLHDQWLHITSHGPELDWLKGRWESIHKTGLLLLYRLQDAGSYCNKVALINGLPATSLACLLFKLISSIKILRIYGPEPINGNWSAGDIMARSDVELAFEEMLLQYGPDFFVAMLRAGGREKMGETTHSTEDQWAVDALTHEVTNMLERQMPSSDGWPKPPTLTSCMRRAFAARCNCHISQNIGKMWELLSSTAFDQVDEKKMVKVVKGKELEEGLKRVF